MRYVLLIVLAIIHRTLAFYDYNYYSSYEYQVKPVCPICSFFLNICFFFKKKQPPALQCLVPEFKNGYFIETRTGSIVGNGTFIDAGKEIEARCNGSHFLLQPAQPSSRVLKISFVCLLSGQWDFEPTDAHCIATIQPTPWRPKVSIVKDCSFESKPDFIIKYLDNEAISKYGEWGGLKRIHSGREIVKECIAGLRVNGYNRSNCNDGLLQPPLGTCPSEENVERSTGVPKGVYCKVPHLLNGYYVGTDPLGNFQTFFGPYIPVGISRLRGRCIGGYKLVSGFQVFNCAGNGVLDKVIDINGNDPYCYPAGAPIAASATKIVLTDISIFLSIFITFL